MVMLTSFPDAYLHDLIADPAEVPPLSGFLPQQVMRVVAESALTVQTQGYSAQGHGRKDDKGFCFATFRHVNQCSFLLTVYISCLL